MRLRFWIKLNAVFDHSELQQAGGVPDLCIVLAFGLTLALSSCVQSSSLPGDSLGSYAVVGTLATNTCGSGVGAQNPWNFTAKMSKDDDTLYLDQSDDNDGSEIVSGLVDSTDGTTATLTTAVTTNVDGNANGVAGPCNLTLSTSFDLVLNDASASQSFTGKATFAYSAATGVSSTTDCTDQLSSSGGKYWTLPCTVQYTVKATRK